MITASLEHRRAAFSLLEMLLALSLISIVAASLYGSLGIAFKARRSADRVLREAAALQFALELLRPDLESATPPKGILAGAFIADNATADDGFDADTLTFHAIRVPSTADDAVGCDVQRIELTLQDDDEQDGRRNLVRRVTTNLLATKAVDPAEEVLCRGVASLNLRYYDGLEWLDSWDSSTLEGELPLAIEVTLRVDTPNVPFPDGETPSLTRVFLIPSVAGGADGGGRGRGPSL